MKGDYKPIPFVEDAAIPVDSLPEYVRLFEKLLADHNTTAVYYAHASVGLLHIRPVINLKQKVEIQKMRSIACRVLDLTLEFGGTMSGEHGDGLVRSEWIETAFGAQIYNAFRQVKTAFDPKGIMNPGKIIDSPPMTENLRYGENYRTIQIDSYFDFSSQGGFSGAIEMCNGVGSVPQETRRYNVPLLHGNDGGRAFDTRPGKRASSRAVRKITSGTIQRQAVVRRAKSLFGV